MAISINTVNKLEDKTIKQNLLNVNVQKKITLTQEQLLTIFINYNIPIARQSLEVILQYDKFEI